MEPAGEILLIVAVNDGLVLGNKTPEPDRSVHLAVCQKVHDFASRPHVGSRLASSSAGGHTGERFLHNSIAVVARAEHAWSVLRWS